ncbi:MAG: hypothetical protein ACRCYR_09080 [Phycicoccus sp.]
MFRPASGVWHVRGGDAVTWDRSGDIPQTGNVGGTSQADRMVFRPSNGS